LQGDNNRWLIGGWFATKSAMFKLIAILVAAIPVVLFLRAVVFKRSTAMQRAFADFKKQIDYLSWAILFFVGCGIAYSVGKLIYSFWN
jgi:hypothetical protein